MTALATKIDRWLQLVRQLARNARMTAEGFEEHGYDELPAPDMVRAWSDSARDLEELADWIEKQR